MSSYGLGCDALSIHLSISSLLASTRSISHVSLYLVSPAHFPAAQRLDTKVRKFLFSFYSLLKVS